MSAQGESAWVQARIVNLTDRVVVALSKRHSGSRISVRFQLPREIGVKTYLMQIRGQNAELKGDIKLVRR